MCSKGPNHLSDVVSTLRDSPFVLFLGAGINGTLSPKWKGVLGILRDTGFGHIRRSLANVSAQEFREHCGSLNYETQAELYKLILGPAYEANLKRCIYTDPSTDFVFDQQELQKYMQTPTPEIDSLADKYELLHDMARLSQRPNTVAVLTLNYDNYLEMSIESLVRWGNRQPGCALPPRVPLSMPNAGRLCLRPGQSFVPIYHLHGFLPYPTPDLPEDSEDIVLSQDEYISTFNDAINISNCTAIHYLTYFPVLFIGLSMCDWNLLRFLMASRRQCRTFFHHCLMKAGGELDRIHLSLLERYGVRVILCSPKEQDPPQSYAALRRTTQWLCDAIGGKGGGHGTNIDTHQPHTT